MSAEKKIKLQANRTLAENWAQVLGGFFIGFLAVGSIIFFDYGITLAVDSGLTFIFDFLGIFSQGLVDVITECVFIVLIVSMLTLSLPLFLGILRYYYYFAKDTDFDFNEIFYYIGKKYFKALYFCISYFFHVVLRVLIPLIPGVVSLIVQSILNAEKDHLAFSDNLWYFISYVLIICGIILALKFCTKYFLAPFIFFENEDISKKELWNESRSNPMRKNTSKLITSLSPLVLLCLLVVPVVYVIPYVLICFSISAKWILELKNNSEEE